MAYFLDGMESFQITQRKTLWHESKPINFSLSHRENWPLGVFISASLNCYVPTNPGINLS